MNNTVDFNGNLMLAKRVGITLGGSVSVSNLDVYFTGKSFKQRFKASIAALKYIWRTTREEA